MPPFIYAPYRAPYTGQIAQTIERQGEIPAEALQRAAAATAQGQLQSGAAYGNAINNVSQVLAGLPGQIQRQQINQLAINEGNRAVGDRQLLAKALKETPLIDNDGTKLYDIPSISKVLAEGGAGDAIPDVAPHLEALNNAFLQEAAAKVNLVRQGAESVAAAGNDPELAHHFLDRLAANHSFPPEQINQFRNYIDADPNNVKKLTAYLAGPQKPIILAGAARPGAGPATAIDPISHEVIATGAAAAPETPKAEPNVVFKDDAGVEHPVSFNGKDYLYNGQVVSDKVTRPTPTATKSLQRASVMLDGKPAEVLLDPDPNAKQSVFDLERKPIENAAARIRPIPPASTIINPQQASDVKEQVAGMKDGSLPPVLPGRNTKEYTAIMAEAHRQGYNLAQAATDWLATQKHISTMNGAQQLRLTQSINALPELLDSVDALASQWKAGRFPLLNSVSLAAAKNGVYGPDAASIANKLDAQIADVTADLGNVYMGGNSPTDHALGLAAKSLSANWDEKVLHDMVTLARQNVTIRQNSIKHTGVAGASPNNPYAPADTPNLPTPERWERGADGKLHKVGG